MDQITIDLIRQLDSLQGRFDALVKPEIGPFGYTNTIINGDFNVWQRGTSFAAIANGTYSADRFLYRKVGTMVHTISRDTNVPTVAQSGHKSNYSIKVDCTTADAAIAATDRCQIQQRIEGYNFQPMEAKTFYLSFWVRATKTGIYCVSFKNDGFDRTYVVEYTVNSASTWERKIVTVPFDFAGGTWDYTNGIGLYVGFALAVGSDFHTTANAWQNGSFLATSNQVNACDSTSNDFYLAQVQFRPDNPSYYVVDRTFDEELAACQRYYIILGTGAAGGWNSANSADVAVHFPVEMRSNPTVTLTTATPTFVENGVANRVGVASTVSVINASTKSNRLRVDGFAGATATNVAMSTDDYFILDSEL